MSDQIFSKEQARNLEPSAKISCSNCGSENDLALVIKEEPLPYPHHLAVEGIILCPDCGLRTHTYYMSEPLRAKQALLAKATADWHYLQTNRAFARMRNAKVSYIKKYEEEQKRYKNLFEKAVVQDGTE